MATESMLTCAGGRWANVFSLDAINAANNGGNIIWRLCLCPWQQVNIFQDFLVGGSEKNNNYFVATFQKISFEYESILPHPPTLHFGNFVTARVAKSIISSKCVFLTPSMDSLGYSKLKSYIWTWVWTIFEPNCGLRRPKTSQKPS